MTKEMKKVNKNDLTLTKKTTSRILFVPMHNSNLPATGKIAVYRMLWCCAVHHRLLYAIRSEWEPESDGRGLVFVWTSWSSYISTRRPSSSKFLLIRMF